MSTQHIEIFDEARVRALLPMPRVITAMEEAFRAISSGKAQVPVRSGIALHDENSRLLVMPASVPGWPFASVKIVSVCPQNRRRGIETINGVIEVFDARTGTNSSAPRWSPQPRRRRSRCSSSMSSTPRPT